MLKKTIVLCALALVLAMPALAQERPARRQAPAAG